VGVNGNVEYLVRWLVGPKDDPVEDEWKEEADLNCDDLLEQFRMVRLSRL
jgi:hypothetical protein